MRRKTLFLAKKNDEKSNKIFANHNLLIHSVLGGKLVLIVT